MSHILYLYEKNILETKKNLDPHIEELAKEIANQLNIRFDGAWNTDGIPPSHPEYKKYKEVEVLQFTDEGGRGTTLLANYPKVGISKNDFMELVVDKLEQARKGYDEEEIGDDEI